MLDSGVCYRVSLFSLPVCLCVWLVIWLIGTFVPSFFLVSCGGGGGVLVLLKSFFPLYYSSFSFSFFSFFWGGGGGSLFFLSVFPLFYFFLLSHFFSRGFRLLFFLFARLSSSFCLISFGLVWSCLILEEDDNS